MKLRVDNFHGIQPRLHPSLLADGMAAKAHNCRLKSGKLVPLRQPLQLGGASTSIYLENRLETVAEAKSLYCWRHTRSDGTVASDFLAFPDVVDFAEGNIADDPYDRIYVTGKTGVPFTDEKGKTWTDSPAVYRFSQSANAISRQTICKNPLAAPMVAAASAADMSKTVYYVYFFVSWVDGYGIESGLSPASHTSPATTGGDSLGTGALVLNSGSSVHFDAMAVPADAQKIYVYVTAAGTSETTDGVQFFKEILAVVARQASGFNATFTPENLGEAEPGIESAPGDLAGVRFVAGGFYTGFSKSSPHTVMFSDIGIVTSWPNAYRYDIKDNIVALATTSNSVFALTDGWPWVLSGTAPESMTVTKLAGPAACVSARGVCVYRNSVYFASNEGLMAIVNDANAGTVCANITQKIFTKEQWQAMNPASCLLAQHDGALFLFFWDRDGSLLPGVTIDLNEASADAVATHDEAALAVCRDDATDNLYFVRASAARYTLSFSVRTPAHGSGIQIRVPPVEIRYLEKYSRLPGDEAMENLLVKLGYSDWEFAGWWTAASGGTQVRNGDVCRTKANHILYARWKLKEVA